MKDATLDHIGIAVKSIKQASNVYKSFGFKEIFLGTLPAEKVNLSFLKLNDITIELIEPKSDDSPVQKFLNKRGEGLHQICFKVENLDDTINMLKKNNIRLAKEKPIDSVLGKRAVFIHPKSTHGVLIELVEENV